MAHSYPKQIKIKTYMTRNTNQRKITQKHMCIEIHRITWFNAFFGVSYSAARKTKTYRTLQDNNKGISFKFVTQLNDINWLENQKSLHWPYCAFITSISLDTPTTMQQSTRQQWQFLNRNESSLFTLSFFFF